MKREFHLGDVLTALTGHVLSPDGVGGAYHILNFLTGAMLMTHQLPRALKCVMPYMRVQFQHLCQIDVTDINVENYPERMRELVAGYGERHMVESLAPGVYVESDPIADAVEMFGVERVIVATE